MHPIIQNDNETIISCNTKDAYPPKNIIWLMQNLTFDWEQINFTQPTEIFVQLNK